MNRTEMNTAVNIQDSSVIGRAKAAGELSLRYAQKTKLTTVSLPAAYRALGKHVYIAGAYRTQLPDQYKQLDGLLDEVRKLEQHSGTRIEGIAAKAKAGVALAKATAMKKSLQVQAAHQFARLGQAAFEMGGDQCGPIELVRPVAGIRRTLTTLDEQIAALSVSRPGQWLTTSRLALGVAVITLVLVLGGGYLLLGSGEAAFRRQLQGEWKGPEGSVVFHGDTVLLGDDHHSQQLKASYSLSPSEGHIFISVPDSDIEVTATLRDENTLLVESTNKPGEVYTMRRFPPVRRESQGRSGDRSEPDKVTASTKHSREQFMQVLSDGGVTFGNRFRDPDFGNQEVIVVGFSMPFDKWVEMFGEPRNVESHYDSFVGTNYHTWKYQCKDGGLTFIGDVHAQQNLVSVRKIGLF